MQKTAMVPFCLINISYILYNCLQYRNQQVVWIYDATRKAICALVEVGKLHIIRFFKGHHLRPQAAHYKLNTRVRLCVTHIFLFIFLRGESYMRLMIAFLCGWSLRYVLCAIQWLAYRSSWTTKAITKINASFKYSKLHRDYLASP